MIDKIFIGFFAIAICAMFVLLGFLIADSNTRTDKAEAIAQKIGCTNLGRARDMSTVYFFDCDGKIELRRVQ